MILATQLRAARALLGWRQEDLATRAKVGLATVARIEQGEGMVQGNMSTILKLVTTLKRAGIVFINEEQEVGVLWRPTKRGIS